MHMRCDKSRRLHELVVNQVTYAQCAQIQGVLQPILGLIARGKDPFRILFLAYLPWEPGSHNWRKTKRSQCHAAYTRQTLRDNEIDPYDSEENDSNADEMQHKESPHGKCFFA